MGGAEEDETTMNIVHRNLEDYSRVVRAYRLARWANHAWGLLSGEQLAEVWNLCPTVAAFCALLPGYAVSRGWIVEGPVGYGVLGPDWALPREPGGPPAVVMEIGAYGQIRAEFSPGETTVRYQHGNRFAQATVADGLVVGAEGYLAEPRDWARVARLIVVAEEPTDLEADGIREALRNMVVSSPTAQAEFDKYFALTGPEILAGPDVIIAQQ
jgi:hypothetical protein